MSEFEEKKEPSALEDRKESPVSFFGIFLGIAVLVVLSYFLTTQSQKNQDQQQQYAQQLEKQKIFVKEELQGQKESTQQQTERLDQHEKEIQKNQHDLELQRTRINRHDDDLEKTQEEIKEQQTSIKNIQQDLQQAATKIDSTRTDLESQKNRLDELKTKLDQQQVDIQQNKQAIAELHELRNTLKSQIEAQELEIRTLAGRINGFEEKTKELGDQNVELLNQIQLLQEELEKQKNFHERTVQEMRLRLNKIEQILGIGQ